MLAPCAYLGGFNPRGDVSAYRHVRMGKVICGRSNILEGKVPNDRRASIAKRQETYM